MPAVDLTSGDTRGPWRRALHVIAVGVRAEPRLFALSVGGSVLYGVMTVAMAQAVGYVTEHQIAPAVNEGELSAGRAWTIFAVITGVVAMITLGVLLRRICGGFTMFNVAADYRRRVTRQYLRLPLAWHHRHHSGQLLSNANADVEATWNVFMPLPMALGVLVMLAAGALQMVLLDPALAATGLTIFPLLFAANALFQRRMSARVTRAQQLRAELAEVAHESFEGALLVKVMGREAHETARFSEVSGRLQAAAIAVGRTRGTFDPVIEAIPTIGTLAVLLVGVHRVRSGEVTSAELVQMAYLISVLAFPVRALGWVLGEIPRTLVGWERVSAVLQAQGSMTFGDGTLTAAGDGAAAETAGAHLTLQDVSYHYELAHEEQDSTPAGAGATRAAAVHRVSLEVPSGTTLAVVGPTGAGKSTLAGLMIRLVDPTRGRVRIDGSDLRSLARGELARQVALVPQATFVFDDTVRGNIALGLELPDEMIWAALRIAQADGFVARLPHGLDTRVGERGASLSGGQRQRIALARALVRRPRLLVLDDATSAVDPAVEQAILTELGAGSAGMTLVVVAYRLSTITLADEVAYLEHGELIDRGSHAQLLARCPGYRTVVTAYAREAAERAAIAADEDEPLPPSGARAGGETSAR